MCASPSICIVTPNYISGTPRVVKEADALHAAGFRVRVVFSQGVLEQNRTHDEMVLREKLWQHQTFGWSPHHPEEHRLYHLSRLRQNLVRWLPRVAWKYGRLAEMGEGRVFPELARLAASQPADIFIGHYPDGLAAAAYAARRWNTALGYDAEDFHTGGETDPKAHQRIAIIESRYLGHCTHISAASQLIAEALRERYGIVQPLVIHNVFPLKDRNQLDGQVSDRQGSALSLYWYSQTIGLTRGIQDAIRAIGLVDVPIQIHLRGSLSEEVRVALTSLAAEHGILERLYFHPPVPPGELLSRAVEHDIGLALEQPVDLNRQIAVTNKLFFYLLAGLCVVATDVPGQKLIMETCSDAGYLYHVGDYTALAGILKKLVDHPELLEQHKKSSLAVARERWNWESESQRLVKALTNVLKENQA